MQVFYHSTRDKTKQFTSSECILKGLSEEGGLFVTDAVDSIRFDFHDFIGKDYAAIAKSVFMKFFSDFSESQIDECVLHAYNTDNFETKEIFSLNTFEQYGYLELYTGRTIAFKDAALSVLPHFMKCAKENLGETRKIVILTATSGDTGKAALEGFRDAEGIDVVVFYPYGGVSKLQLLQMLTQEGNNVFSFALHGNFDDAQTNVKEIFNDNIFAEKLDHSGVMLSSANSINIGRLIPQIVYYYYSYAKLIEKNKIKPGDPVNFVVPTGNFGNILAGYYAYKTGLPVHKLICSSNENNVLTDFFETGIYDKNRVFRKTISPSMDILISSNLERFIYELCSKDTKLLSEKMKQLKESGVYSIDTAQKDFSLFCGGYATEQEIRDEIKESYEHDHYLIDTHTATGRKVYRDYRKKSGDETYTVILATASPFKFSKDVYAAIDEHPYSDDIEYMYALSRYTGLPLPKAVDQIERRPAKAESVIDSDQMREKIYDIITR
ncbi:MAG: threonine synthase [Anaerofustis sp.]